MLRLCLLLTLLTSPLAHATETVRALAPLGAVVTHLERATNAYLDGADLATAVLPWVTAAPSHKDAALRTRLTGSGVAAMELDYVGLNLKLYQGLTAVFQLKASLLVDEGEQIFSSVQGRKLEQSPPASELTGVIAQFSDSEAGKPFASATQQLLAMAASRECESLLSADAAHWMTIKGHAAPDTERFGKVHAMTAAALSQTCQAFQSTRFDTIVIELKHALFLAKNADGATIGTVLARIGLLTRGEFGEENNGEMAIVLQHFDLH